VFSSALLRVGDQAIEGAGVVPEDHEGAGPAAFDLGTVARCECGVVGGPMGEDQGREVATISLDGLDGCG